MADLLARMRQIVGTTAQWTAANLVLGDGEIAIERETAWPSLRIGNGVLAALSAPKISGHTYEEGTFTPVVFGASTAGVGTYTTQTGRYIRVGNAIHIRAYVAISAHTGTGSLGLSGLPFAAAASPASGYNVMTTATDGLIVGAGRTLNAYINPGTANVSFTAADQAGAASTSVLIDPAFGMMLSGTYFT